jgi:hypothetical protein
MYVLMAPPKGAGPAGVCLLPALCVRDRAAFHRAWEYSPLYGTASGAATAAFVRNVRH